MYSYKFDDLIQFVVIESKLETVLGSLIESIDQVLIPEGAHFNR